MATGNYDREREALRDAVNSPEIGRSPNLTRILTYLCEKHFAGESAQVKEYHIALEALGRTADFDQKKDSIVRVEMHRLRRRLKQYNDRTGTETGLQILIPEKSYTPTFSGLDSAAPPEVAEKTAEPEELVEIAPPPVIPPPQRSKSISWVAAGVVVLAVVALFFALRQRPVSVTAGVIPESAPVSNVSAVSPTSAAPGGDEKRILCGRPPGLYVDRYGQTWDGDRYSKGGEAVQVQTAVISSGFDRNVFRGMRVGHQTYQIPLKQGIYQMEMLFAETEYGDGNPLEGGELSRPFRVLVNGETVLPELDIIAETVQPNVATSRIVTGLSPTADGMLHIELQAISTGEPFVNAIIIRPATGKQVLPVRILCRTHRYRDSKGRIWEPDHYFRGGSSIIRPTTPSVPDGEIFRGERYGKFTYAIPVVAGAKYQATLYLWESWLGPGRPGEGGVGTRIFSVLCNTVPLFRHYDLIADTGPDQVKIRTFRDLEPDRNGMLVFSFDAEANKALLNAIEVIDQSM